MDNSEINRNSNDIIIDDSNLNKIQNKCQLDIEMEVYIEQACIELENLLDVKKRIIVQQKLIQQQLDEIQMLIRKQTKQIRNMIDDHLRKKKFKKSYSECSKSDFQQYKNQILDGFDNLCSKQIYQNLTSNLEWASTRIQRMTKKLEQNFSQYFQNTQVYLPNTDFFNCMINYDYIYINFSDQVLAAAMSNDQKILICSSANRELCVWDLFNVCERKRLSAQVINSICFSKFDNVVYLGGQFSLKIMNLCDFNIIHAMNIDDFIINIIEKEQNVLITYSKDQIIRISNIKTKDQQIIYNNIHPKQINNIDYSNKYYIILGSSQSQILLWNAQNGEQVGCFQTDFDQMINQSYFSQKQDKIAAISFESNIINIYTYDHKNRNLVLFNKYQAQSNLMCISWTQQDEILTCILEDKICSFLFQKNMKNSTNTSMLMSHLQNSNNLFLLRGQFVHQPDNLRDLFYINGKMLTILEQQYQEEFISQYDEPITCQID
ncbi:hypothetical protein pb186bvf_000263 [Paramecium bursaria]